MSVKVIKNLQSNYLREDLHEIIKVEQLKEVNNYFEIVYGNKPARLFIDLDGSFTKESLKIMNEDNKYYEKLNKRILRRLIKLEGVSIMESSSLKSNKLSYRITYINEYCDDYETMKHAILTEKYPELKKLLDGVITITTKKESDTLNIDESVYRTGGKTRCVNAYKTEDDKTRINKLVKGDIIDTIITHIPEGAYKRTMPEKEEKKEEKKEQKTNVNVLDDIKMKVLKLGYGAFDNYQTWLNLCFIIYNESNGHYTGKKLFIELCKEVCSNFNEEECEKKWYSVNEKSNKKITMGTLNKMYFDKFPEEKKKPENQIYTEEKKKFEKRIFRLDNPFKYAKINTDDTIEFMDDKKLSSWTRGEFSEIEINENDKTKKIKFVDLWLEDKNKRKYNQIIFDPSLTEQTQDYNCWTGFKYQNEESTLNEKYEDESTFFKLLKHKMKDDLVNYEFVKQWIAHIIQKPHLKTNIALVFYSETKGAGKNCLIDGILKLLEGYTGKLSSIEDITKKFNVHLTNKLFIYGDEICAKATAVADRLKEVITRKTQNLEKKNIDPVEVNDLSNYAFTTNNYDAFKIEQGCRRLNMIHCTEDLFLDSVQYYKDLADVKKMTKLFNYLRTYKITYKIGEGALPPMSQYKKELQYNSYIGYMQMLYKQPSSFTGQKFTPNELMKITNDYCKINYLKQTTDIITYGKTMGDIFKDYKKRSKTSYVYNFKELTTLQFNEILYKYDEDYFKFVNNLSKDDKPDFTEDKNKKEISKCNLDN